MSQICYYSQEGLDKLKIELQTLKKVERKKVAIKIAEARSKGDLSENAEYNAAKETQNLLEIKIRKLEETIHNARVLSKKNINTSTVSLLNSVKVQNQENKQENTYIIVSEQEADLQMGKISIHSPIAKGLLGKKIGEMAIIKAPAKMIHLKILQIW